MAVAKIPSLNLLFCPRNPNPRPFRGLLSSSRPGAFQVRCSKRTGKQRYPSEKKKLQKLKRTMLESDIKNREDGIWRLSKLAVPAHKDPGKDCIGVSLPLLEAIAKVLKFPVDS